MLVLAELLVLVVFGYACIVRVCMHVCLCAQQYPLSPTYLTVSLIHIPTTTPIPPPTHTILTLLAPPLQCKVEGADECTQDAVYSSSGSVH